MKNLTRLLIGCCAFGLLIQSASAQAPSRPFLTGKWAGVLTAVAPQGDGSPSVLPPFQADLGQIGFRLDIRQTNLVMYFQQGDQWAGLGEGQDLRLNEQGRSSVVITALPAGPEDDPLAMMEGMMLNIVRWDEDTIAVFMSRVIGGVEGDQAPAPVMLLGQLSRADF